MMRQKVPSAASEERATIVLRRGFCPVALLKPPLTATATEAEGKQEEDCDQKQEKLVDDLEDLATSAPASSSIKKVAQSSVVVEKTRPLVRSKRIHSSDSSSEETRETKDEESQIQYYEVCYAKASSRKHKKWESDGYLGVSKQNGHGILNSEEGRVLTSSSFKFTSDILDGQVFKFGGMDVQISSAMKKPPQFNEDSSSSKRIKLGDDAGEDEYMKISPTAIVLDDPKEEVHTVKTHTIKTHSYGLYNRSVPPISLNPDDQDTVKHYRVVYAKKSTRKNKRWESDGFMTISRNNSYGVLKDEDGRVVSSSGFHFTQDMLDGYDILQFGGKDVKIDSQLQEHEVDHLLN